MRWPSILMWLAVLSTAMVTVSAEVSAQPAPDRQEAAKKAAEEAQQALKQFIDDYHAMLRSADPAAVEKIAAQIDPQIVAVDSFGRRVTGKQPYLEKRASDLKWLRDNMTDLKLEYETLATRMAGPLALVSLEQRVTTKGKQDGKSFSRDLLTAMVLQRRAQQWFLILEQSTAKGGAQELPAPKPARGTALDEWLAKWPPQAVICDESRPDRPLLKLRLANTNVTDAELSLLAGATTVQDVDLYGTTVTDSALDCLKPLVGLKKLYLGSTGVTDRGCQILGQMKGLTALHIQKNNRITDAGLKFLVALENLEDLNLWGDPITDEGLASLKSLKRLHIVNVGETKVTPQGAAAFMAANPGVQAVFGYKVGEPPKGRSLTGDSPELKEIRARLDEIIQLFAAKRFKELVYGYFYLDPEMKKRADLQDFSKTLTGNENDDQQFIATFRRIRGMDAELVDESTVRFFMSDTGAKIGFRKFDGKWLIVMQ